MRIALAAALALAVALPGAASAAPVPFVPGELIVKLRHGESPQVLRAHGATPGRQLAVPGAVLARVPLHSDLRRAARALERDPRIAWAQPNVYVHAASVPNDALFAQQWSLNRTDGPGIDAPQAWDHTTGSAAVRVAIVDSGINFDEPDLAPNIGTNPGETGGGREDNGIDDDGNGFVDDWRGWDFVADDNDPSDNVGHGTHVSGIVAARGDNGIGIAGVAWRASLIGVRVLDNLNVGTCDQIADGMAYAVRAGAQVVNLSLGSRLPCELEHEVIESAPGVLFVIAAMNDSEDVDSTGGYPCAFPSPNIICVAATDTGDQLAGFSNYGAQSVDLAAPGDDILSTFMKWGPKDSLFKDGFETDLAGRWVTGGSPDTWGRSFTYWRTGSWSLSDSPSGQYADNTNNYARLMDGLDLTGKRDCAVSVYARTALDDGDLLISDTSPDGVTWARRLDARGGTSSGFERWLIDLSELEGRANGGLAFHLLADGSGTNEGAALDDLEVFCVPPLTGFTGAPDEFAIDWGTSMATPHVTGTAALMLALAPQLTPAQLKQVILATADPLPSLDGKTVTGGRLNAGSAVGLIADALAQVAAPSPPAPPPPPPATTGQATQDVSRMLAADLRSSTRRLRIGDLLRRRGVTIHLRHSYPAGAFSLRATDRGRRTIAAGRSLTAKLTRSGASRLRRARRMRLTLALTFAPASGQPVVAARTVVLRR